MCLEISIFRCHTWDTRPSRNSSKSLTTHTGFPPQHITRIYLMKWETRQNSAKHDNKWQSRNSHNKPVCSQLSNCTDSSKDYTMLRKAAEVPVSDTETTETSYKLSYLFTHKPTLAISRDPKLVRHDSGWNVLGKNQKNISYKPRPRFLNKKFIQETPTFDPIGQNLKLCEFWENSYVSNTSYL